MFGLEVSVADGSLLNYNGYIECILKIPFIELELYVPVLIVPDTNFNRTCPVIIGTNVLKIYSDLWEGQRYERNFNIMQK